MKLKTIQYGIQDGIAVITFDEENSPVNTMCLQWQDDLDAVAAQVAKDKDAIRGIILASAKSTFFAGADLKGVMRMKPEDATRVYVEIERIKKNFRIIETLGKPVVSCLNGTALGGGWEVALVGHHRIAVNNPKTQFGLPEVTLGLIPGGGGITKMTRQLGLMAAQPYLLESKLFGPAEAQKLGFVHALVDSDAELMPAARAWIDSVQGNAEACQHVWDRKGYKMPGGTPSSPAIAQGLVVAPAMLKKTTRGLYPAPEAALCAMVEGAQVDFDTAMRIESRYLAGLMVNPVAKNMINTFFFNLNAIKSGQSAAEGRAALQAEEGRHPGRRHDGRGHRLFAGQPWHRLGAERREPGKSRARQGLQRQAHPGSRGQGPHGPARPGRAAGPHHPHRQRRRPAGQRPDHRGRVREPRAQGQSDAGGRAHAGAGRLLRQQHLHPADQRPGHRQRQPGRSSSASTSSARWTR
jgi:enoyl-CoA hydratase/carnithine racemase